MTSTTSVSKSTTSSDDSAESESMYHRLADAIEEYGEVMVIAGDGAELELHKHTVEFEDAPYIKVEAEDEVHWIDTGTIGRYYIHEEI